MSTEGTVTLWNTPPLIILTIFTVFSAEETTFNDKERDQFEQLCACYVTDLLPYLNKCLQSLFPPAQVAQAMGVSVMDMARKVSLPDWPFTAWCYACFSLCWKFVVVSV